MRTRLAVLSLSSFVLVSVLAGCSSSSSDVAASGEANQTASGFVCSRRSHDQGQTDRAPEIEEQARQIVNGWFEEKIKPNLASEIRTVYANAGITLAADAVSFADSTEQPFRMSVSYPDSSDAFIDGRLAFPKMIVRSPDGDVKTFIAGDINWDWPHLKFEIDLSYTSATANFDPLGQPAGHSCEYDLKVVWDTGLRYYNEATFDSSAPPPPVVELPDPPEFEFGNIHPITIPALPAHS